MSNPTAEKGVCRNCGGEKHVGPCLIDDQMRARDPPCTCGNPSTKYYGPHDPDCPAASVQLTSGACGGGIYRTKP